MLSAEIQNELINKTPFLISSFKNINNIITYIKDVNNISIFSTRRTINNLSYLKLINHVKILLEYHDSMLVISPWHLKFDLNESSVNIKNNIKIDYSVPYKVYDLNHNLLYTVVEHNGIFGASELDKWLVQKSKNMSTYLLEYYDVSGMSYTQLLVVNLYSEKTITSNPFYKPPEEILETKALSLYNQSSENVTIYILEDAPSSNYSISNIKLNGEELLILANNQLVLNRYSNSFWILFDSYQNIVLDTKSSELIIPVLFNSLYYIGLNTKPALLNKTFDTSISTQQIKLNQELIII